MRDGGIGLENVARASDRDTCFCPHSDRGDDAHGDERASHRARNPPTYRYSAGGHADFHSGSDLHAYPNTTAADLYTTADHAASN